MNSDLYDRFSLVQRFVRLLGRSIPEVRGKERVMRILYEMTKPWPSRGVISSDDGSVFCADLGQANYRRLYVYGTYEPQVSWYIQAMLKPGNVFFDVGANYGLYVIRAAILVGTTGMVYAFEPLPEAHWYLEENIRLNNLENVVLNKVAVGARCGSAEIHRFQQLPVGHSSLSSLGRTDVVSFPCDVITLDEYVALPEVRFPDVIKLDVEGSERSVLLGASNLLRRSKPAVILEINYETAHAFDYEPEEIVAWLADIGYLFYFYSPKAKKLRRLDGQFQLTHGSDILCVGSKQHRSMVEHFC